MLQFRGIALGKFHALVGLESALRGILGAGEYLEGIEPGACGTNLFITTDNPAYTFQKIRPLFEHSEATIGFVAAYRPGAQESFRILWPGGITSDFHLDGESAREAAISVFGGKDIDLQDGGAEIG